MRRSHPPSLPPAGLTLIGRETLLASIEKGRDAHDVVVLHGAPGSGKTAILRHLTQGRKADRPIVDFEGTSALDEAFGRFRESVGAPIDREIEAIFSDWSGRTLFVDHGEGEHIREFIALGRANSVRFVIASREMMEVRDEYVIEIGALAEDAALELLTRGAKGEVFERGDLLPLLERVDYLPLGIEIVGAWLLSLDPKELLRSFTLDLPARNEGKYASLEAAIAWSWRRLADEERDALLALAPFHAGGSISAIERALGRPSLRVLEALRKRSLGVFERGRFRLFRAVEDYARSELAQTSGESTAYDRHARAVLEDFADLRRRRFPRSSDLEWLALEHANLAAVADRYKERDARIFAEALLTVHPLLLRRGPLVRHEADLAGARSRLNDDDALKDALQIARAEIARFRGDADLVVSSVQSIDAERLTGLWAEAQRLLAWVARTKGEWSGAERILEAALRTVAPSFPLEAQLLIDLGAVRLRRGFAEKAREAFEHALDLFREGKYDAEVGVASSHLGVAYQRLGNLTRARQSHSEALAIHIAEGHARFAGAEHMHLGYVAVDLGEHERALDHFREAEQRLAQLGEKLLLVLVQFGRVRLEIDRGRLDDARLSLARGERWLHDLKGEHRPLRVEALRLQGHLAAEGGDWRGAYEKYEQAAQVEEHADGSVPAVYFLALAAKRAGLECAKAARPSTANPMERLAVEVLRAAIEGGAIPTIGEQERSLSSELRLVLRFVEPISSTELVLGPEGRWFSLQGKKTDLARRASIRKILVALVERRARGEALSLDALVQAGWPNERMLADAAKQRAYTAVWTLRSLGIEIDSDEEGYRLRKELVVRESKD